MAAFLGECLSSSLCMFVNNWINCKLEKKMETYTFVLSMLSKSLLASNQSVFKDLNIIKLGINKTDAQ